MPFTTLSWWMLVPKVTEEIGFAAEGGAGWLFIALPCCTELCEGAVLGKTEQWHHCAQQAVLTGWFYRDWSGEEQHIADTLPNLAPLLTLSAGKCHDGFAPKKLLRLEEHPHPQGQDKKSWCLERHWGHSGPQMQGQCLMAQALSRGAGCPESGLYTAGSIELNRSEE